MAVGVVGVGEVGLDADGGVVLGDRRIQLPLVAQEIAEGVVELGGIGLEADGGLVFGDRVVQLPLEVEARSPG